MIGTGHRNYAVPAFMQAPVAPAPQQQPPAQPQQQQPQPQQQQPQPQPVENGRNNLPNPTQVYSVSLEPGTPAVFRTYPAEAAAAHLRASSSSQPPLTSPPPPSSLLADVCCRDAGSATPRFLRMTHWELPARAELARAMALPLACVVTPLAEPAAGEAAVPLVDHGAHGPLRCARCHAYVSPFARFTPGGAEYTCAVCGTRNDVPAWFGALLAADPQHPVLTRGSVEYALDGCPLYAAPGTATGAAAKAPVLCVVLDASRAAVADGRTAAVAHALRDIVAAGVLQDTRVGFVSYAARAVHFWDIPKAPSQRPRALLVPDVTAMFCPLADTLFVSPVAARDALLAFLDRLPELAAALAEDTSSEGKGKDEEGPCFGAAVQDAALAFKAAGLCGRLLAFCGDVPTGGVGALVSRDDPAQRTSATASAEEQARAQARLLRPAGTFYAWLAAQCAAQGVGVDVFATYAAEADLASVGELARLTGGVLRALAPFAAARDTGALRAALWQHLARPWGCHGAFRVRASRGLGVRAYCGAGAPASGGASVDVPLVDSAATLAAVLAHEGDLAPGRDALVQAALLYTTRTGARRVRVHTAALPVAAAPALVYRGLDGDALAAVLARLGARDVASGMAPAAVARAHTGTLADALATYRAECAPDRAPGQLVLPEAAQRLPLHVLAMQRAPLLRARACRADQRTALLRAVDTLPVPHTLLRLYPRLYSLGTLHEQLLRLQRQKQQGHNGDGEDDKSDSGLGGIVVEATRLARGCQNVNDVYLVDDGTEVLHVWLTGRPPAALLAALFGALPAGAAQSLAAVGAVRPADAPALEACLAARLAAVPADAPLVRAVAALVARLAGVPVRAPVCVRVATASMGAHDAALAWALAVEDAEDGPSYPEYIRTLHTLVRQRFA